MTHYQFLFADSGTQEEFRDGRDLDSLEQARQEAVRELSYMMASRLPDGAYRHFSVTITDEVGIELYSARLVFEGRSLD